MATTTNYGWTTPDDTALVKDGAAAIRTLGSSVDTTTKNLNPSTTLGDIEYRSSTANTNTRLGIGTTGQVLTVSGGVPAWNTISAGGMTLLSTTTLSGTSTDVTGISQDYTNLYILITGVTNATGNANLYYAPNSSGDNATNYVANGSIGSSTGSYLPLTGNSVFTRTDANNAFAINIYNYTSTTTYKPFAWSGYYQLSGASKYVIGGGGHYFNAAITSILVYADGLSMSTGTIKIYGVK